MKKYVNSLDCCNVVRTGLRLLEFYLLEGDHSPGEPGKVRELQSDQGKVGGNRKSRGIHNVFLQAREGKHIE